MRDLAFAFVWLTLLPLTFMSAHVGVLLWIWVALLSPNELLYGFMAGVPFNKIVAVMTLGLIAVSKEKKDIYLDSTGVLLILFVVAVTISWYGAIVSTPDATDLYQKFLKEVVLAFAVMTVMTTRHRIHLVVLTVAISFGFLAVKEGLIFLLTAGGHKVIGTGSVGDNNSLATAVLMTIPMLYYLARHSAVRITRIGLLAALGLAVVTVIATFSRGGFVGLMVVGLFMVKNSRNKFSSLALVVATGVLIYLLAPESWFERLNTINDASDDGSFMGRVVAWKISWLIAMDHPLFGGGMHAVQRLLVWDTYRPYLYLLDSVVKTPPADTMPHAAHSTYFEVLGDTGFVGFTLFMAMLGMAFWNCRSIIRMGRQHPSLTWAVDLGRMLQISLVVYCVTTALLSMGYFELLYVVLALLSRCRRTVRQALVAQELVKRPPSRPLPAGATLPAFATASRRAASPG